MPISKKRFLKHSCISVVIHHDLVVAVIDLLGYSTDQPWSYSKTKEITL